jgi:hypothetical protein
MAVANQTPADVASEYATLQFVVRQLLNGMATATLVRVMACTNAGGVVPVGTVDVSPLVDMVTEQGETIPHGTIFKAPYMRIQGGASAIILDPQPGDIGVCVFAMRDISAVKGDPDAARDRTPSPGAPPGSRRTYSLSDALYLGGMLNGVPTQYVRFSDSGIELKTAGVVTVDAPTVHMTGNLNVDGTITGTVDVIAGTISGKTHTHSGGTIDGDTGTPNA